MNEIKPTGSSGLTLAEKMRKGIAQIREEKRAIKVREGIMLLLDVSGSMAEMVESKRKIDHLRNALGNFPDMRRVSFSQRVWENEVPDPQQNTDMVAGFRHLQTLSPKTVILVSDGLPDEPEMAIQEAKYLGVPVNVLYIGVGGDAGEAFMKRLAQETGGREVTVETAEPDFRSQLESGIGELLALPKGGKM